MIILKFKKRIVKFFVKMNIQLFGTGVVNKLYDNGFTSIEKIVNSKLEDFQSPIMKIMVKIIYYPTRYHELWINKIMSASNILGRGLAEKIKTIINQISNIIHEIQQDLKNIQLKI